MPHKGLKLTRATALRFFVAKIDLDTLSPSDKLLILMYRHKLTASDIAEMTGRSLSRVYHWVSGRDKPIPRHFIELIELKIPTWTAKHEKETETQP